MRTMVSVLLAVGVWLTCGGDATAQKVDRSNDQKVVHNARQLAEMVLYQGPELEHFFAEGQLSLWLPGFWTFDHNHVTSAQLGAEVGAQVLHLWRHHLYVVGGLLISPQVLEQHLGADASTMVTPWVGLRYISDSLCTRDGSGCLFAEFGSGLTFEITSDDDETHHAPNGAWAALLGFGYRKRLGTHVHLGARIDFVYIDDRWTSELAWITPTFFGGSSF